VSISAVSQTSPAFNIPQGSSTLNAIASSLDAASQMTQMMNALLMNLLRSAQQANNAFGNPAAGGAPQQPGLGGLGALGGAGGAGGAGGLGGLGGLLQSFGQLLQAMTPLLQALGNGGLGANRPATQLANGLTGGLGTSPLGQAGSQFGAAAGNVLGGAPGAQLGSILGGAAGNALAGAAGLPTTPVGANPLVNAGSQIGALVGNALGGAPGAQLGAQLGATAGAAASGALAAAGVPTTVTPGFTPNSVNTPAMFGNMTPEAARAWALANGGENMTAKDVNQGVALYSIFNTGSNRVF
jgi:hypothetical protein